MRNDNCPQCDGRKTVLVDVTRDFYPNRAARRKAQNEKIQKYLPCPKCTVKPT